MSAADAEHEESIRRINKIIEDLVRTSIVAELPTTNAPTRQFIVDLIGLDLIGRVRPQGPEERDASE